ncbi:COG2102 Predicted ATPases of PP-loop superfamily [Oxalobacteraceae bacterium]
MSDFSFVSWSGGKDSCLALWRSQQSGFKVTHLLTALEETGSRVRSHGVSVQLMRAQAAALKLDIEFLSASWKEYEYQFIEKLTFLKSLGIQSGIFGDIDLIAHREWEEKVCGAAGIAACLPLWNEDRLSLVNEFFHAGFKARVSCVDGRFLDDTFVGCEFDQSFIDRLPAGVDACGENGEFHTFVYNGPNFINPVQWVSIGKKTYVSPPEYGSQTYYFDELDV